ncbi:Hypothetical predicted protein [Octopus vulgaris]|uniref:Uncharacterized protein n=1 Tax=Octopus vulgaris TaxID=6645 RepID=A0AA36AIC5_OCTVU|nr:Hypothetical predicted protein [Octopus vulgaris]
MRSSYSKFCNTSSLFMEDLLAAIRVGCVGHSCNVEQYLMSNSYIDGKRTKGKPAEPLCSCHIGIHL